MIKSLKSEVEDARKTSEELEKKYTQTAEELDGKKMELEDIKKQNRELEKKIQELTLGWFKLIISVQIKHPKKLTQQRHQ